MNNPSSPQPEKSTSPCKQKEEASTQSPADEVERAGEAVALHFIHFFGASVCEGPLVRLPDGIAFNPNNVARAALSAIRNGDEGMREALIDIRNRILCPVGPSPSLDEIAEIASTALDTTKGGGGGE